MATREIKARLSLDGEQQYKAQLKDAESALRRLRSELKAETAEMGKNASEQDKARAKSRSLQAQIKEQEKIVHTLTAALEQAKLQYADNQQEQDRWAVQLNNARTTLANMRNALEQTNSSIKDFSGAMKDVKTDSQGGVQAVASFGDAINGIADIAKTAKDTVTGVFDAMTHNIEAAATAVFTLMSNTWAAAGDYGKLRDIWGGSEQDWEKMIMGANAAGFGSSDLTGAISKLVDRTHDGNADTMKVLKQLGIDESQFSNHTDYFMAVMEAAAAEKDPTKRLAMAQALFGDKKGEGGAAVLEKWGVMMSSADSIMATGGAGVGDAGAAMEGAGDAWQFLMTNWDEFKTYLGKKFTLLLDFQGLTEDATAILQNIMTIFGDGTDDARKTAVIELSANIEKLVEDLTTGLARVFTSMHDIAANLMASDDPKVQAVGKLMDKLADLGDWFVAHIDDLIKILDILSGPMMYNYLLKLTTGKGIGEWASTGLDVAKDVAMIKGFGGIAKALGGGALTAGGTAGAAAANSAAAAGTATTFSAGFGGFLSSISPAAVVAAGVLPAVLADIADNNARLLQNSDWTSLAAGTRYEGLMGLVTGGNRAKSGFFDNGGAITAGMSAEQILSDPEMRAMAYALMGKDYGEYFRYYDQGILDASMSSDFLDILGQSMQEVLTNGTTPEMDAVYDMMSTINSVNRAIQNGGGGSAENFFGNMESSTKEAIREGLSGVAVYMDSDAVVGQIWEKISERIAGEFD